MATCSHCHTALPESAKFCLNCGQEQIPDNRYVPRYVLDLGDFRTMPSQIRDLYIKFFQVFRASECSSIPEHHIIEMMYRDGFYARFDNIAIELTALFEQTLQETKRLSYKFTDQAIERQFYLYTTAYILEQHPDWYDYAPPLYSYKYTDPNAKLSERSLILDYLHADSLPEEIYTSVVEIPGQSLANARQQFLFLADAEYPIVFFDQSLRQNGSDGFALTNSRLYWKAHFHNAANVHYRNINSLERKGRHLEINGKYFNVSPELNFRMYRLLRRLQVEL
jgi:hypothetical protein